MTPSSYVAGKPYCQCWTLLVFCVQNHLRSHPQSHLWYHCFLDWRRMCWLCVHKKPCDVLQRVFVSYKSWSFLNIRDSFRNLRKCRLQLQNSVNVMKQSRVEQRWLFMLQNVWQWQNVLTVTVLREPTLLFRIICSVLYCGSSWWVRNKNWNNDFILFVQDSCLASSCFPTHCFAPSSGRPWSAPAPPAYPGHLRHLPLQLLHHHAPDKVCPQFMLSCHDGVDFQIYR